MAHIGHCRSCNTRWYWGIEVPLPSFNVRCPNRKCKRSRLVPVTRMCRYGDSVRILDDKALWKGKPKVNPSLEDTLPNPIVPELAVAVYVNSGRHKGRGKNCVEIELDTKASWDMTADEFWDHLIAVVNAGFVECYEISMGVGGMCGFAYRYRKAQPNAEQAIVKYFRKNAENT